MANDKMTFLFMPAVCAGFSFIYCVLVAVYRVYFHPLRHFPGPKTAAITKLYRAWFQIIRDGGQLSQWNKLHEEYGDIVRIGPNQLHFSNPAVFDEMTSFASPFTKSDDFWEFTGQSDAILGTSDEKRHKELFKPVASLFSQAFIKSFEPIVWDHTKKLCGLLHQAADQPVNMAMAFRALMLDNVLDFIYDETPQSTRGLQDLSFSSQYLLASYDFMDWSGTWPRRNFPVLLPAMIRVLPNKVYKALLPGDYTMAKFIEMTRDTIRQCLAKGEWHRDCFLSRFSRDSPLEYLTQETTVTVLGGIIDASNVLQYGLFRVCSDSELAEGLRKEIDSVWPAEGDAGPETVLLQKLPLLTGVILESLRLTHGIIAGPPRTTPSEGAMLGGARIPGGTTVTTSSYYPDMNPAIFDDPEKFQPTRWEHATPEMTRSICAFSKGRRQCPAKQMVMNKIYIAFAALLHDFIFEAYQTSLDDFEMKAYLSGHFKGRPFHAKVRSRKEIAK